jgi:hypothetical protein
MKLYQFILTVVVFSTAALAADPHFISATYTAQASGAVTVSFHEAGLGNTPVQVNYLLTVTESVQFACINKAGNQPSAANKHTTTVSTTTGATFTSNNGQVQGTITAPAPSSPGSGGFSCPRGLNLEVLGTQVTSILLQDTTNGVQIVPT